MKGIITMPFFLFLYHFCNYCAVRPFNYDNAAIQLSYAGEEAVSQAGVSITNIGGNTISASEASEAFDEPLTKRR